MNYTWHLISPEYPPSLGGVADYTRQVAHSLQESGKSVHVWAPGDGDSADTEGNGVVIHRLRGGMSQRNLKQITERLTKFPGRKKILVQWVPHGFGYRSMNLFLCQWLRSLPRKWYDIELMVHEPFLQLWEGSRRQDLVAAVHRVMMVMLLRSADRVWVSTPDWGKQLRPWAFGKDLGFKWLPVPSNVRPIAQEDLGPVNGSSVHKTAREVVGHFGTYGVASKMLQPVITQLLMKRPSLQILLIGRGSCEFRRNLIENADHWKDRIEATGALGQPELSAHIQACDVLLQPFPDGVNGRRGSVMAALAHGRPVVTTEGRATEQIWKARDAVALAKSHDSAELAESVCRLLDDPDGRARLGRNGLRLYDEVFDLRHTINALMQSSRPLACESSS